MIAVTGAAGKLGSRIASRLSQRGIAQRLIVRDTARTPKLKNTEVAAVSSYADISAMTKTLSGVETLFLVSARDLMGITQEAAKKGMPPPPYDRLKEQTSAIDAAKAAGVKRIVYLSFLGATENPVFTLNRDHYRTEQFIHKSGLAFTFLRPCLYMENVPLRVSPEGIIQAPAGNGKAAWVTRDDIADAATAVLTSNGHEGCTYDITGPEALTMDQTATVISRVSGKKVRYITLSPEETRLKHNASGMAAFEAERKALTGRGLENFEVEIWTTHYTQIAAGALNVVNDTVSRLTGHQAMSLEEYLRLHPESYAHIR
jgi:NAD(P)H dehydrogenase (quinone)